MRVLIAYGSKRGGTAGLAEMIAHALVDAGVEPVVRPAAAVHDLEDAGNLGDLGDLGDIDAVIVAGALYAMRWHRDARRFVRKHRAALRRLPVWMVSSGPLDDSATKRDIPPTGQVRKLAALVAARGHVTFGGRLEADAKGFPASAMAKKSAGDWRDPEHVRAWVASVVGELAKSR